MNFQGSAILCGMLESATPSIYTVIVNWNLPHDTIACIDSLLHAGSPPEQIILVDNGSHDHSLEMLMGVAGLRMTVIASPKNLGFSGGNNLGIRCALTAGAEWVLLANNDTVVAPDFYGQLARAIAVRSDWRLIAPAIFYHDEPQRIWSLGEKLLPGSLITRSAHRGELLPANLPDFIEFDLLTACGLLIHRSVFETIGLLDDAYFMYGEDADFCWRARQAGFRMGCATQARMWHKVSRSTGVHHPQARYWRVVNLIRFYRTHARGAQRAVMWTFSGLQALRLAAVDMLAGRATLAVATAVGWRDGWFGQGRDG